ncbi:MFS transporter [Lyngbya aestuarii]|uniref:MFS transporter n=1 Tax=Lyngbya aestuarii TaxID=118322 RepID=UPI00403E1377
MKCLPQWVATTASQQIPTVSKLNKLRLTIGSFLGLFLHGQIVALPGAVFPQWQAEFGDEFCLGCFYNLFLLGSLIGISLASRSRQRHPLIALSLSIIGIAFLMSVSYPNFNGILVGAVLSGSGDGILCLQCNSLVGELHPKRRVKLLNWANATFGLGAISAPLLDSLLPWRTVFALCAILALVSVALVWQAPAVQGFVPKADKMPWRRAAIFLLLIMLYTGLESALGTWSSSYLLYRGVSVTLTGTLLSLYWSCITLGKITLGGWVGKQPAKSLSFLLGGSLVFLTLTLIPQLALLLPLAAFFYGPLFATLFALLQESCGHVALTYFLYAAYIGKTAIPVIFGWLNNPAYLPYGFVVVALILYLLSLQLNLRTKN